ncbi:hypothetical protein [Polynucleobacter necessarius]|uniref:hypothetical protein n=1 Tax=Polynucleobacter necessarius TaxID=576610 RepID=UPI0018D4F35C|nr:hypothetical protein [Polynucleobacter necessarius]
MKTNVQIHAIYLAHLADVVKQPIGKAKVTVASGIEGDRFALGTGKYSAVEPSKVRHSTLIALSGIEVANEWLQARG